MLGSTADSLFWMFRYIERVENTLCMIESGFQLYLLSSNNLYNEWDAILKTNSIRKFRQLIDIAGVDYPDEEKRFKLVYLFLSHENNIRIKLSINFE